MKKVLTIAVCLVIALAFAGKAYSLDTTTTAKDTAKTTATTTAKDTANTAAPTVVKDKVKVEETAKGTVTKEKATLTTTSGDTVKVKAKETTTATGTDTVKAKITDKPTVAETAKTGLVQEKVTFKSYNANNNTITVIKDKKEMTVPVKNPQHWANTKQFENKTITYTSTYDPKMLTQVATDPKLAE